MGEGQEKVARDTRPTALTRRRALGIPTASSAPCVVSQGEMVSHGSYLRLTLTI